MSLSSIIISVLVCIYSFILGVIPTERIINSKKGKSTNLLKPSTNEDNELNFNKKRDLKLIVLVFFIDFCKGFFPLFLIWFLFQDTNLILAVGLCLILGDIFSPLSKLKNYRGWAIAVGVSFFLFHLIVVISAVFWYVILKATKKMAVALLSGLSMCTILVLLLRSYEYRVFILLITTLILFSYQQKFKKLIKDKSK